MFIDLYKKRLSWVDDIFRIRGPFKTRLNKLKEEHGEDTVIVSGGCKDGADKYAKKYALELGLQYEEYPPSHFPHNLYCGLPESRYGKEYSPRNYHVRNKIIAGTSTGNVGIGETSPSYKLDVKGSIHSL